MKLPPGHKTTNVILSYDFMNMFLITVIICYNINRTFFYFRFVRISPGTGTAVTITLTQRTIFTDKEIIRNKPLS